MLIKDFESLFPPSVSRETKRFGVDGVVFHAGAAVRGVYAVEAGRIKLERYSAEGRASITHVASAGECFAESALFTENYHCSAIAAEPSRVVLFRREDVLRALRERADVAMRYITLLSSEVQSLRTRLELSNILSARERIVAYLQRSVDPDTHELILKGTLKELATELGLAHETLYRELRSLEQDRVVRRRGRRIRVEAV